MVVDVKNFHKTSNSLAWKMENIMKQVQKNFFQSADRISVQNTEIIWWIISLFIIKIVIINANNKEIRYLGVEY